ncbi:MAG: hypothetical protein K2J73_08535 [Oscillospiraceae bacterium]|nr:hypothetical protein [Oscillospiraceae bacterium]
MTRYKKELNKMQDEIAKYNAVLSVLVEFENTLNLYENDNCACDDKDFVTGKTSPLMQQDVCAKIFDYAMNKSTPIIEKMIKMIGEIYNENPRNNKNRW